MVPKQKQRNAGKTSRQSPSQLLQPQLQGQQRSSEDPTKRPAAREGQGPQALGEAQAKAAKGRKRQALAKQKAGKRNPAAKAKGLTAKPMRLGTEVWELKDVVSSCDYSCGFPHDSSWNFSCDCSCDIPRDFPFSFSAQKVIFGLKMVSRRPGRYLERFLELVASS